jgi:hypothetical protein
MLMRVLSLLFLLAMAGCSELPSAVPLTTAPALTASIPAITSTVSPSPLQTPVPSLTLTPAPTLTPPPTPTPFASGPDAFPAGVNPLTGLALEDPSLLELSPALLSIANAPASARPQAGLSYAAQVYEFFLGEGSTRFLAVFYGGMPPGMDNSGNPSAIGPLRSGRLPYETLRRFYNGFLVFASAAERVLTHLEEYQVVQNPNIEDINGASVSPAELLALGEQAYTRLGRPALTGQHFDPQPPPGGKPAGKIWVDFHRFAQTWWVYGPQIKAYTRWQDDGDGTPLRQQVDRINNQPLAFENVVVMYTNYVRWTDTYFNIDFKYIFRWPALLFRDGQMYEIFWTTRSAEFEQRTGISRPPRWIDAQGNAFALRPGRTWVEIMQLHNPYYETVDTQDFKPLLNGRQAGSGIWGVVFLPPDYLPEPTPGK